MKNESVKKSLEKSKNILEEKRKMVKRKNLHKKDQHVYNNCNELRSRAINRAQVSENVTCQRLKPTKNKLSFCYGYLVIENQLLGEKNVEKELKFKLLPITQQNKLRINIIFSSKPTYWTTHQNIKLTIRLNSLIRSLTLYICKAKFITKIDYFTNFCLFIHKCFHVNKPRVFR